MASYADQSTSALEPDLSDQTTGLSASLGDENTSCITAPSRSTEDSTPPNASQEQTSPGTETDLNGFPKSGYHHPALESFRLMCEIDEDNVVRNSPEFASCLSTLDSYVAADDVSTV
jgi:hypothetical protein